MLYIKNIIIYTPDTNIHDGAILIDGAHIAAVGATDQVACPAGAEVIDASGLILAPGFIDLQVNGAFGHDFTADPSTIWQVAAGLPRYGVTAFLPTVITSPLETITAAQEVVTQRPAGFRGTEPLGLHVEGPFLNPKKKGAHNPAYLREPDLAAVADWLPAGGVRLVTLAPELPGALELAATLAGRGVVVSAGHSMATFDQATAGFAAGIRYGTHLFNAMPALAHREPGLPGALLTDPRPIVGFIADGIHTHPSIVKLAWHALGRRMNLVTDCIAALGMKPGRHLLGEYDVFVDETSCRLADGTLAGSIVSLDQAVRNLIDLAGATLAEALATVTTTPARLLGIADQRGRVAPGYIADLVLLSPELRVQTTFVAGQVAFSAQD